MEQQNVNAYKNPDIMQQEVDYHSLPGLSNSRLKLLRKSPLMFKMAIEDGWEMDVKKHHIEGDMIDKMLLNYSEFEKNYMHQTWETPSSENQIKFCHKVAGGVVPTKAYDESYKSTLSDTKLKEKSADLFQNLKGYIDHLRTGDDRATYNDDQKDMLMSIQNNALKHPTLSKILGHPKKVDHKVITRQLLGELFKCEVDLYLDLTKVVWNLDLKSTGKAISQFPYEYRKFGYNKQQVIYHKLIREELKSQGRGDIKIRTGCIAVEKNFPYQAYLYEIHPRLLVQGWQWVRESVDIYKFHEAHGYEYPPRTYDKGMELITPYQFDLSLLVENSDDTDDNN